MIGFRSLHFPALAAALLIAAALPANAQDGAAEPRQDRLTRLVKLIDKDGDGAISDAEAQAFAASRFDKLDSEHKGYLTLDAFEAPLRRAIDRASEARRPQLEKALPRAEAAFKAINKAGDGHLTKDEFLADSRARFAAADTDKDGKLSLDELRHARGHAF
jgi:Ca2+-binding EF-hand superfamily protein